MSPQSQLTADIHDATTDEHGGSTEATEPELTERSASINCLLDGPPAIGKRDAIETQMRRGWHNRDLDD